jgi:HSP90 family molecular chaperone
VRRILIQDTFDDIVPKYLNFVRGVIDSDDLPLNVNRESLQQNKILKTISKKVTKKIIDMIAELSKNETSYKDFWKIYGKNMKMGLLDQDAPKDKIMKLLRFKSSKNLSTYISFEQYLENKKEGQDEIYFMGGESK